MRIVLIAVGSKMPAWVTQGYEEYARRMPPECGLHLVEIPAGRRGKNADLSRIMEQEGTQMLAAIPNGAKVIAMDVKGRAWSTEELARQMEGWRNDGRDIALLVGGPEGLAPQCLEQSDQLWSLSTMTLPHPLVRIVIAEQLYRAWSIISNHPYHRQ
ncbi:23S rRNA (pseudouridine(1915)-N(3))-methyltransferase RlmH [Kaarinaea lacus]